MPDQPQSSGLKTALASGAEIGLARAISGGRGGTAVKQFIQARLGDLTSAEVSFVTDLAHKLLSAAQYIVSLGPDEDIDSAEIPTNEDLFGDDWGGKRLFWFGEWSIPGVDEWYQFSGTLPDISTFPEISVFASQLASGYIEAYPTKFHGPEGEVPIEVTVRIIGIEKRF